MKKPTTEELKKEIERREWKAKSKDFQTMLGRYYARAGEKGSFFEPFRHERMPDFPEHFHPTKIVRARGMVMGNPPAMEGEWFTARYDGSMSFTPNHNEFWKSDWREITKAEFEAAWKAFCALVAAAR